MSPYAQSYTSTGYNSQSSLSSFSPVPFTPSSNYSHSSQSSFSSMPYTHSYSNCHSSQSSFSPMSSLSPMSYTPSSQNSSSESNGNENVFNFPSITQGQYIVSINCSYIYTPIRFVFKWNTFVFFFLIIAYT